MSGTTPNVGLATPSMGDTPSQTIPQLAQNFQTIDNQFGTLSSSVTTNIAKLNNVGIKHNRILKGLLYSQESGHFDIYSGDKAFDGNMLFDNAGNGWLNYNSTQNPWIRMALPTGVVIGDSIAEGHPNLHGRLHLSDGSVNLNYTNSPGQISYHIEQFTKLSTFNQGIGGQTAAQVRARWNRDVLAQTYDPGDGRPTKTLSQVPIFVVINVGINDVYQNRSASDIQTDIGWMIDNAVTNGIFPIVNTIPPDGSDNLTTTQLATQKAVNAWLVTKQQSTPNMALIDLYTYLNDPANDGHPKSGMTVDGLHPTKTTYERIARMMIEQAFTDQYVPVVPKYINFSSAFNWTNLPSTINRPTACLVYVNDIPKQYFILPNDPDQCIPIPQTNGIISTIKIEIAYDEVPLETSSTGQYVGWAEIYLSDTNLFPDKFDAVKNAGNRIIPMTADSGTVGSYPYRTAMPSPTTPGNVAYANASNLANVLGPFVTTAAATAYICVQGICQIQVDTAVYPGDFLVTNGTGGVCTRSTSPTAGTVVAQVVKGTGSAGICLARKI